MTVQAATVEEYLESVPDAWKAPLAKLRRVVKDSIPPGFEEAISYSMIGYVVPRSLYPAGYHAKPDEPLPFINLAAQKNYISLYHLGLYAKPELYDWFEGAYREALGKRLDIGKSCMRFRSDADVPYGLVAELVGKMGVEEWIGLYERGRLRRAATE